MLQSEHVKENCIMMNLACLEPVWGTVSLLAGEKVHGLVTELYGEEQVSYWKRKYHFLFEVFPVIEKNSYMNLMDFLLDFPLEKVTLESYKEALLVLPQEEFLWRVLALDRITGATKEVLCKAFSGDEALDTVYGWLSGECESFLKVSAFIRQSRKFIAELFELSKELQTEQLEDFLKYRKDKTEHRLEEIRVGVQEKGALAFSEELLGKTFKNRGPYTEFVFLVSYLMPARACRYFQTEGEEKRQLLFLSNRDSKRSGEDTVVALKAISDGARYRILSLLAKEGPMRGVDIAKRVSLATSTISHHMEQLKESGMITEEQVKSAKYYGLNRQSAKTLIEALKNDFDIEDI